MSLNTYSNVNQQYSPLGASYSGGIRVGSFFNKGMNTVGMGVPVGNTQAYSIQPAPEGTLFDITVSNNSYVSLASYSGDAALEATFIPNSGLQIATPRCIEVSSSSTFCCRISMLDRYNQQVVCDTGDTPVTDFITATGANIITSIYFYNTQTNEIDVSIDQTDDFELPYTDNGHPEYLENVFVDGRPDRALHANDVTPYGATWDGELFSQGIADVSAPVSNKINRPIYNSNTNANGEIIFVFVQNIDNYGFQFGNTPYASNVEQTPNNLTGVIGYTPYKVNWQGFIS